jgi:hypothetical protein
VNGIPWAREIMMGEICPVCFTAAWQLPATLPFENDVACHRSSPGIFHFDMSESGWVDNSREKSRPKSTEIMGLMGVQA